MEHEVRLSVRELVEFLLRSGDIDSRYTGGDRAQEGARIHRRLQKAAGDAYHAEVPLTAETEYLGVRYRIEGRADGVITEPSGITLDEIKTTTLPEEKITEDFSAVHWGQAMCYAYMYCKQQDVREIDIQLTYYQVDTDAIIRYRRHRGQDELEQFFFSLLEQYHAWAQMQAEWKQCRDDSIHQLAFPYDVYRSGQKRLAQAVYRTAETEGRLFCQAPTGIGKTVSTLFPAVKAMGQGYAERIFYLTAKTITRQTAEESFARMREKGLRCRTITLTAKDKICFLDQRDCRPEVCPYADGYFDRVNAAVFHVLQKQEQITRPFIEETAKAERLCPYEFSLDLSVWCDAVICDYNYLFDPVVYLKRFFTEGKSNAVFLIDEAHNLPDRAREMYSASLRKSTFLLLRKQLGTKGKLSRALGKVNTELIALRKQCGEKLFWVQKEKPESLLQQVGRLAICCEEWLEEHKGDRLEKEVLSLYFELLFFQRISELYHDGYVTYAETDGRELNVKFLCLDPASLLDQAMQRGRAAILFSATFSPLPYFATVLGGTENAKSLQLPSPFPEENLLLVIAGRISTKYKDREDSMEQVAELLYRMVSARKGNYLAYFPSYKYMQEVSAVFQEHYSEVDILVQQPGATEQEREAFLERFQSSNSRTLLGFCVLGGIYAEGIDLQGERLIGTAVVGVGLPQISTELEILRRYYDEKCGGGFAFAYQYPGMNKVMQAAGRVIRSEHDRGVVLLIDSRFTKSSYQALFPAHWTNCQYLQNISDLDALLGAFWRENSDRIFVEKR